MKDPKEVLRWAISSLENHCGRVINEMAKPKREVRRTWYLFFMWWPAEQYIRACIKYINSVRNEDIRMYRWLLGRPGLRIQRFDYETWVIGIGDDLGYTSKLRIKVFYTLIGAEFIWKVSDIADHSEFKLDPENNFVRMIVRTSRKDWKLNAKDAIMKALDWDGENN